MPHPFSNNHINNLGTLVFTLRVQLNIKTAPSPIGVATTIYFPNED